MFANVCKHPYLFRLTLYTRIWHSQITVRYSSHLPVSFFLPAYTCIYASPTRATLLHVCTSSFSYIHLLSFTVYCFHLLLSTSICLYKPTHLLFSSSEHFFHCLRTFGPASFCQTSAKEILGGTPFLLLIGYIGEIVLCSIYCIPI